MARLTLRTKELKAILKTFSAFAAKSIRRHPIITLTFEPKFRMIMSTDSAFVDASPQEVEDWDKEATPYSFTPDILLDLALSGPSVTLSWTDARSQLTVKDGRFSSSLKVAATQPLFDHVPQQLEGFSIPLSVMAAINHYMSVPQSFYPKNVEMMPVHFTKDAQGKLLVMADDNYSVAQVRTDVDVPIDLDVKVPKYILDTLYRGIKFRDSNTQDLVTFQAKGYSVLLRNKEVSVFTAGLNDAVMDFDSVAQNQDSWDLSCRFIPSVLSSALKPLLSLIPAKERSGTYIEMAVKEQVDLSIKQKDVGDGKFEAVDGFQDIVISGSASRALINMHPQAFADYTGLLDVDEARMFANKRSSYYEGKVNLGANNLTVRYMFPTVTV